MKDYTIASLKEDFPQITKIRTSYLILLLDAVIEQFIPIVKSEWSKKIGTDYEVREDKDGSALHIAFVIKGKINSVYIWPKADLCEHKLQYSGNSIITGRPYATQLRIRDRVRFYGDSSEYLNKKFRVFVKSLRLKDIVRIALVVTRKKMAEDMCNDIENVPWIVELEKFS